MGTKSLPLKFMFVFSLSLTVSSSFHFPLHHQTISSPLSIKSFSFSSFSSSSPPKASASDLLSLLGPKYQASTINPKEAEELKSCLKFLVPFSPTSSCLKSEKFLIGRKGILKDERRSTVEVGVSGKNQRFENELVWWPPEPVLELARIAMDSGGDPGAIHRTLDPTVIPVPDVEGSNLDRCELTRTPYGRRFISEELNSYMEFLFKLIAARGPTVGLHVSLSRFDLFHGHLFLAKDSGRLGILFHAKEYPAYEKDGFPYNLGYCQIGSNMVYDSSMNLRNILWLAPLPSNSTRAWVSPGVLVVLDAHPGGIIYEDLIPEYVNYARTIYEDDFGDVVVDVNYLNVGEEVADYKIFIC